MTNTYDIGDLVDMFATFTDPSTGDPVTPDTVVCTVKSPAGSEQTPTTTTTGTPGQFTAQVAPTEPGAWWYAFDGSGGEQASGEQYFVVRVRSVPR